MRNELHVPEGWKLVRLATVADVRGGDGFPIERQGRSTGAYPFIKVSDMNSAGNELYIRRAANYIDERDLSELGATPFPSGTIVFPKIGAAIATNKKRSLAVATVIDNNIMGVTVTDSVKCDTRYLRNWFEHTDLSQFANISTVPSITSSRMKRELILLPPPREQRAIAAVLDSIDEAIERTEALVAATERLRDALLHELLTRGVPGWHSEWKDAPGIGTIPACWDVVRLGDAIADGPTNGIYKPASEYGTGTWLIRIDDFVAGALTRQDGFERIRVSDEESEHYAIYSGDVLINRVNSLSHLGKAVLIPELAESTLFESNMMRLRMCSEVEPGFAMILLLSRYTRRYFISRAKKAVQQASINQQDVTLLPIPLPGNRERTAILETSVALNDRILRDGTALERLKALKASAADALLTGRVRAPSGKD